jgi:hypothetical protein
MPIGLREVKYPTLLRQTANRYRQGCQPYARAALYPQVSLFLKIPGTHFCYRLSRPQGHSAASRIRQIKKKKSLRDSNPRLSCLQHSALTTTLPHSYFPLRKQIKSPNFSNKYL